jgi:hypothetical protein
VPLGWNQRRFASGSIFQMIDHPEVIIRPPHGRQDPASPRSEQFQVVSDAAVSRGVTLPYGVYRN